MILYHGTTKKALDKILIEGIKPRGSKKSNWDGFGTSRPDLVYLTNCYAPYYATSACKKKEDIGVIIKLDIDSKKIELYPDEEFLFNCSELKQQAKEGKDVQKLWNTINPKKFRLVYDFRNKTWEIGWKKSIEYLGTVTAEFIPKVYIIGYYIEKKSLEFIYKCDPSISPLNYMFCGQQYKDYLASLKYTKVGDNR